MFMKVARCGCRKYSEIGPSDRRHRKEASIMVVSARVPPNNCSEILRTGRIILVSPYLVSEFELTDFLSKIQQF